MGHSSIFQSFNWVHNLLPTTSFPKHLEDVDGDQDAGETDNPDSCNFLCHSHPDNLVLCPKHRHPDCLRGTKLISLQSGVGKFPFLTFPRQTGRRKFSTTACVWAIAGNKKASKEHQTYCACFVQALCKCVHTFRFYAHVKISCPGHAWWVACCGRKNGLHSRNW